MNIYADVARVHMRFAHTYRMLLRRTEQDLLTGRLSNNRRYNERSTSISSEESGAFSKAFTLRAWLNLAGSANWKSDRADSLHA